MKQETIRRSIGASILMLGGLFFATVSYAQVGPPVDWANQFGGIGAANDFATAVATDSIGNVYVSGTTNGNLPGWTNAGQNDVFLRKYDSTGNLVWSRQFGTVASDSVAGAAVDGLGGIYICGGTDGSLPGYSNAGATDAWVRKYDPSGNLIWTRQFGTLSSENALAVTADTFGLYVSGQIVNNFLPGQLNAGGTDAWVRKYDLNGNEIWTRQFGSLKDDGSTSILVDSSGVYVGGSTQDIINDPVTTQTNSGQADSFVRKYDLNGVHLWSRTFGMDQNDLLEGLTSDGTGIYAAGFGQGALPGFTSAGSNDSYIRKFTPNGAEIWTRQFGTAQSDGIYGAWADASGVYVCGFVNLAWPGQTSAGSNDAYVRKYTPDGTPSWTSQFGSLLGDQGVAITGYASGVYIAGQANGALPGQTSAFATDAYLRQYTTAGSETWTRQFGFPGASADVVIAIATDGAGSVYVTGSTNGQLAGQTALGPWGATDIFLRKYNSSGTLLWTRTIGTAQSDVGTGLAADSTGVYLGGLVSYPGSLNDALIQKYDPNGNLVWTEEFGSTADDRFTSITLDASGIYVSGFTTGTLPGQVSSNGLDAFIRKYNHSGTPLWTHQFGTGGTDNGLGIAAGSGGVYVVGSTSGSLSGQLYHKLADGFVRKYDVNGNELWTRLLGTNFSDEARRIALDNSGIYIAGTTSGVMDDPSMTSSNGSDIYVRKYAHDGTHLWTRQFGSTTNDSAWGIAADGSAIYVAGLAGILASPPFGGGVSDGVVRKYDIWGNVLWTATVATPLNDKTWGVAVDGTGVYIGGETQGTIPGQTSAGDLDGFVVKLVSAQCTIPSVTIGNISWNKFTIPAGTSPQVWVNAHIGKPRGVSLTTKSRVYFTNATLTVNGIAYQLAGGLLTFDPAAPATISTQFNAALNRWETVVNPNAMSDEIFILGAAIPATAGLATAGNASLSFSTFSESPGLSFSWVWSAAAYTFWPADWNQAQILPFHQSLHAGSPLNPAVQSSLIQGPRGGAGSNYTGGWSATGTGSCTQ